MSTTEHITQHTAVSRYCGAPAEHPLDRVRIRIDHDGSAIVGIEVHEALLIAKALVHLAIDSVYGEIEANGRGRTD